MKIVIDTSVLISLAKINYMEIIAKLKSNLILSNEVYEEAVVEGEKKDLPDATLIKKFIKENKIAQVQVKNSSIKGLSLKIEKNLSKGDASILALALQENAVEILTDDEGLAKLALFLDFKVSASSDLIFQSLSEGIIKYNEFDKHIKNLVLENRLSPVVAEFYIMEGKKYDKN
ncbi:MAG: PIN domain-containing protein [bacterium]